MSYSNNYSITTLSSSIYQRTLKGGAVVAPFVFGAPKRGDPLRETCQPGAVLGGVIPTGSSFPMPWDREGCIPPDLRQTILLPLVASTATTYLPDVEEGGVTGSYPLIASTSVVYSPTIIPGGMTASLPLVASTETTYLPNIFYDSTTSLPLIASTTATYLPDVQEGGVTGSYPLIASTSVVYTPSIIPGGTTSSLPLVSSTATAYLPNTFYDIITSLPLIASTATTYLPDVQEGGVTGSYPLIASTSVIYTPTIIPGGVTASLPLVPASSQVFAPTIISSSSGAGVDFYTQIVSASNPNNSSSLQVGSLYLDAQTYTTIGALFTDIKGGVGGSNAHVEFKRFTTGASLLTLNNTSTAGPTWRYITGSNVVVSNADWYDIYISASGNPATSSIRGVYYEI
jgi:hypothetical protein